MRPFTSRNQPKPDRRGGKKHKFKLSGLRTMDSQPALDMRNKFDGEAFKMAQESYFPVTGFN